MIAASVIASSAGFMKPHKWSTPSYGSTSSGSDDKYVCKYCKPCYGGQLHFTYSHDLTNHIDREHPEKQCEEPNCSFRSRTKDEQNEHYRRSHQTYCPYCNQYIKKTDYDTHLEDKHPSQGCLRPNCNFCYRSQNEYISHLHQVHQQQCRYCRIYIEATDYDEHMSQQHPILNCPHCSECQVRTQEELRGHIDYFHYRLCPDCNVMIMNDTLKTHYQTQHNINTDSCQHCLIACLSAMAYIDHIRDKHNFVCRACSCDSAGHVGNQHSSSCRAITCRQVFPYEHLLTQHIKKAHLKCKYCDVLYMDRKALNVHKPHCHDRLDAKDNSSCFC